VAADHWRAVRDKLEEHGVIGYRPGSEAESERLVELIAENEALRVENAKLRERVADLEGRSE
jgi:regulator of replication initiation timing